MKINEFLLAEQPPAMTTAEDPKDPRTKNSESKQLETVLNARKHKSAMNNQKKYLFNKILTQLNLI